MSWPADHPPSAAAPGGATDNPPMESVDIRALAEKVYRLMLAEARLELARGGRLVRSGD